jgi:hypothetical protein
LQPGDLAIIPRGEGQQLVGDARRPRLTWRGP